MKGTRHRNLYYLNGSTIVGEVAAADHKETAKMKTAKLWHMRLAHTGEKSLNSLIRQNLLKGATTCKLEFCEHCVKGKKTRASFGTAIHNTSGVLDYVHSDVWGPSKNASLGGKHWFVSFIDDFSRRVWVYTMRHKDEVLEVFVKWKKATETQTGRKIKVLRSDNGGEYTSDPFLQVCQDEGIQRHFTVRMTPQQNGVAERMNRTLLEKVRCMLSNAGLGKAFWAEAVTYACFLINRLPSAALGGKTPIEVWYGKPAYDYDSIHVFGCPAYYHVRDSKLDPRARKAFFMGTKKGVKGYKLWDPVDKKMIMSRDVTFDEDSMMNPEVSQQVERLTSTKKILQQVEIDALPPNPVQPVSLQSAPNGVTPTGETTVEVPDGSDTVADIEDGTDDDTEEDEQEMATNESIATEKGKRNIKRPGWMTDYVTYALPVVDEGIPVTYSGAIHSVERDNWENAMRDEMDSLHKNETWVLAKLPKGKKAIGCKWVYAKKEGSQENEVRYKARLVAKGYAQKEGIDYNEVFSPVVKHSSIRILLALVAQYDLDLVQLDVKTAFLHGDLDEEIYMTQPVGFKVAGKENCVCKLKRSLYGLKQSPRQWYKRFDRFMLGQTYTRSHYDHCVYFKKLRDGSFIYLLLYVDDMLIASRNKSEIERLKQKLSSEFEMKDLGDAKKILGMEIQRDRAKGKVCLSQKAYLKKILAKFGISESTKSVSTPLAPHFKLNATMSPKSEEERKYMAQVPYANAVGSLMYAMVCTRPDISHAVSMVSRYMHAPGKGHWYAVKWILRYIYGTVDVGLEFSKDVNNNQPCVGYVDSDYAGDLDKRRSTTGYVFTLAGGPVSWRSILQSTVALSTTEAEYMAVTEAFKEAIWLQGLLDDLGVVQEQIPVHCDSMSAIYLAKNQVHHARTKHIDVRFHFVREIIEEGDILLVKIDTKENPADMLTKVVSGVKFKHCLDLIQILHV